MKVYHNKLKRRFFIIISSLSAESYREGLQAPTETCKTTCVYTHTHTEHTGLQRIKNFYLINKYLLNNCYIASMQYLESKTIHVKNEGKDLV